VNDDHEFTRRMVRTVLTVGAVVIGLYVVYEARDVLMIIYISALVAMGFSPLVRLVEHPGHGAARRSALRRIFAILAVYVAIVVAIVLIGFMVVPPLVDQAETLWLRAPEYFNRFQAFLIEHRLSTRSITIEEAVQNAPAGAAPNAVGTVLVALWSVVGGVFGVITVIILSFYLLIEAESIFVFFMRFVPDAKRASVAAAARQSVTKVSAWLRAQLVLAGVMGLFSAVGLAFFGVPYFYVVALVAAFGETIPIVGPVIGGVTAVTIALTVSPKLAFWVGVYFLVLHQLEANILVPKIMERRVGVSPVAVMIALLVGGALWGLVGAILAIPTTAILSVMLEEFGPR
jgi:predicted PurR-regulated permease PerM